MENIKSSYVNNKYNISAATWNDKFELPYGSYSISDCFECIRRNHETFVDNSSIKIYIKKKIENRILFKIKTGYSLELLTTETMNLLGSTEN